MRLAFLSLLFFSHMACAFAGARVVDGDTLWIDGTTYRIHGIDAPEVGQKCAAASGKTWPCGKAAVEAMQKLVAGGDVACKALSLDDYGRTLATCATGGADIAAVLVEDGLAWAFRRYSLDYAEAEDKARAADVGIWQATTEPAWEYRAHRWDIEQQAAPKGCPIKGNINREGERIYHAPWSPWYTRTKVNEGDGERWFCSEGEALAAGWRAPLWGQ